VRPRCEARPLSVQNVIDVNQVMEHLVRSLVHESFARIRSSQSATQHTPSRLPISDRS